MNLKLMKLVDNLLGSLLVRILPPPAPSQEITPKSFLVIRPGGIGDAVLLIPAIQSLKHKFPGASITIIAEKRNAEVFQLAMLNCRTFLYDRPEELNAAMRVKYDVVIDTEQWHRLSAVVARMTHSQFFIGYATNYRKRMFNCTVTYSRDDYEVDSFLHLLTPLGVTGSEERRSVPFLVIPDVARGNAGRLLGILTDKSFVAIFPGASVPERRWGATKFADLCRKLKDNGIPTVVVGGKEDIAEGELIVAEIQGLNLAAKTSLIETAAIIERASVLVSGDSGILHIGVGLDRPTVSLFGPGISQKWAPRGNKHIVINKNLPCSPCTRFGYTPECQIGAKCMVDITAGEVAEAVMKLLAGQEGEKGGG